MPAVQEKINLATKSPADEHNLRAKVDPPTKKKARTTSRKTEANWERLSQPKRRTAIVPELDLKSLFQKTQNNGTNSKGNSKHRSKKDPSARTAAAKLVKQRQWDVGNAYSKVNLDCQQAKILSQRDRQDDYKTSRSLYCPSPRQEQNNFFVDMENINPNQLHDTFIQCDELENFFQTQFPDFENSSEYDYQTAKLCEDFDSPSQTSLMSSKSKTSPGILRHFKQLLYQEENSQTNLLGQPEIGLLKDIVKADERHQQLRRDDYKLLKDILQGQLKEIEQHERVIKIALKKIRGLYDTDVEVTTLQADSAEQPMEDKFWIPKSTKPRTTKKNPKQQIDIFKNVPSVEQEFKILRSLGLKLEETLKKSERTVSARENQRTLLLHTTQLIYFRHCTSIVTFSIKSIGIQSKTEIAKEFQIRLQTIDELKLEREFFIPTDLGQFTLQRTNFHVLSRNPDLLLQRFKPFSKYSQMKFNIIEQDPIFFNHFITKLCKIHSRTMDGYETYIPSQVNVLRPHIGSGDQPDQIFMERTMRELKLPILENTKKLSSHSLRKKKRQKRTISALVTDTQVTAKNRLLKVFLLGTVQLSIILTIISAVFYPDVICL